MKIGFVLPMPTTKIVGGYKVVYQYANYIAANGNDVTIFFNSDKGNNSRNLPKLLVHWMRNIICRVEPKWFNLSRKVEKKNLYTLDSKYFKDFDVVIATAAETAPFVNSLKVKKKVYLVQDFEAGWKLSKEQLIDTYKYNMNIIVVSKWLYKLVKKYSINDPVYIPNGIDSEIFFNKNLKRKKHSIAMLYHLDHRKGFDIGFKVLKKLRKEYPDLSVRLFGAPPKQKDWPDWISYTRHASQMQVADIMNNSQVFLCTSREEGFGLTGLESLFCGCNLVTTDCGGIKEYANINNSQICNINAVDELKESIENIFDNKIINKACYSDLMKFDLNLNSKKFLKIICEE